MSDPEAANAFAPGRKQASCAAMAASTHAPAAPTVGSRNLTGIALIVAAVLVFSCIDASAKWLNRSLPPMQIAGMRYVGSFLLVALFMNPWNRPGLLRTANLRRQVARSLCLVLCTAMSFIALRFLPLAQFTAINFASPLIVALLAGPTLGEHIGPRRLAAVIVGLAGVLVVTRPFGHGMHPAVFLVCIMACASAVYAILTRLLAAHDRPETTMFYTGGVGALILAPVLPFVWHAPATAADLVAITVLCTAGALGHWLMILAHRIAAASVLAPFYYLQLLGAIGIGRLVFGERPDRWTIAGGAIVIGSGLYLLYRERIRRAYPSADVPG